MTSPVSPLTAARAKYQPQVPPHLRTAAVVTEPVGDGPSAPEEIRSLFPKTTGMAMLRLVAGDSARAPAKPLVVGVVLSGGPASGGHNTIAGLLDGLLALHPESRLVGFLGGPRGVILNRSRDLTPQVVADYRNTGGFDIIGSGRDKIESAEDMESCLNTLKGHGAQALVVVGGDDSNTNAALLAEFFAARDAGIQVIGLPKTIDGDMKSDIIETSFGFDSACKTYANLVANICRDARSAGKYYHFVKLMGRAASHVALEVALQVHPNVTIISEEVLAKKITLNQIVEEVAQIVVQRAEAGKNYGVVLVPEGLIEFLPGMKDLLNELDHAIGTEDERFNRARTAAEKVAIVSEALSDESALLYGSLPHDVQKVLLIRDKHGNLTVSQVETDRLLMNLVQKRVSDLKHDGKTSASLVPLNHFFGYEGRCCPPSNFDADYCYGLGLSAAHLIRAGVTGYTVYGRNLAAPHAKWEFGGVPVTSMLHIEMRKGKAKPVIRKALVEIDGPVFGEFDRHRAAWAIHDDYQQIGGIQYFGPPEVADARPVTLLLEHPAQG